MGLSTLVAGATDALTVTVRWGDYVYEPGQDEQIPLWRRLPREQPVEVTLGAIADGSIEVLPVTGSGGLELHVLSRALLTDALEDQIPAGTRSVSLFLVNNRTPDTERP